MLRYHSPMSGLSPLGRPGVRETTIRVRPARGEDRPALGRLLTAAGVSRTGLQPQPGAVYVLERGVLPIDRGELLGCVVVEHAAGVALLHSLVVTPSAQDQGHDALLLDLALKIAHEGGAEEALLLVETAAQVPATRLDSVPWAQVRACFPTSALVRELSAFDTTAMAVRMALPALSYTKRR
jgi:N-acetylglutamate synthase-like GNAT family acetyltransferase